MSAVTLEACPFCGGKDIHPTLGTPDREGIPTSLTCADCSAQGPWEYEVSHPHTPAATAAWNCRANAGERGGSVEFVGEVERVGTDEATGQPRVLIHGEPLEIRGAAMCVCRGKYRFTAVPLEAPTLLAGAAADGRGGG